MVNMVLKKKKKNLLTKTEINNADKTISSKLQR